MNRQTDSAGVRLHVEVSGCLILLREKKDQRHEKPSPDIKHSVITNALPAKTHVAFNRWTVPLTLLKYGHSFMTLCIERVVKRTRPLLAIAEDVEGKADEVGRRELAGLQSRGETR